MQLTKDIFNRARGFYVSFGQWDTTNENHYRSVVFVFTKSNRQLSFDLLSDASVFGFPRDRNPISFDSFWNFILNELSHIFYEGVSRNIRFSKQPILTSPNKDFIISAALTFGFTLFTSDRSKTKQTIGVDDLRSPKREFVLWKLLPKDNISATEIKDIQTKMNPELGYYKSKRSLERLIEEFNVHEDFTQDFPIESLSIEQQRKLVQYYKNWLHEMIKVFGKKMPETLHNFVNAFPASDFAYDDRLAELETYAETNDDEWSEFFMGLETKYPVLLALAYTWRLHHLLLLVWT